MKTYRVGYRDNEMKWHYIIIKGSTIDLYNEIVELKATKVTIEIIGVWYNGTVQNNYKMF